MKIYQGVFKNEFASIGKQKLFISSMSSFLTKIDIDIKILSTFRFLSTQMLLR